MSQYPSPYQPQQPSYGYYADPYGTLRGPARRASILMFVLGGILCLCGACCADMGPILSSAQLDAQTSAQLNELQAQLPFPLSTLFVIMGVISALPGLILIVLGFFVRGGGLGAVITAIICAGLCALGLLLFIIGGLAQAVGGGGDPNSVLGLAMFIVILAPFLLLLFWLIQAARNAGQISAAQAQYQSQYWQYQQQQQAYQQQPLPHQQGWPPPPPPPPNDPDRSQT